MNVYADRAAAYHEAAHAVGCEAFSIPYQGITLNAEGGGTCHTEPVDSYSRDYLTMVAMGPLCERRLTAHAQGWDEGVGTDWEICIQGMSALATYQHRPMRDVAGEILNRGSEYVHHSWQEIGAIAARLIEMRTLLAVEVHEILLARKAARRRLPARRGK